MLFADVEPGRDFMDDGRIWRHVMAHRSAEGLRNAISGGESRLYGPGWPVVIPAWPHRMRQDEPDRAAGIAAALQWGEVYSWE